MGHVGLITAQLSSVSVKSQCWVKCVKTLIEAHWCMIICTYSIETWKEWSRQLFLTKLFLFADLLVFLNLGAFTSALWIIHKGGQSEAHRSRHVWWDVMTCTFSMYYSDGRKIKSLQLVISSHVRYYIKVLSCSSKSECWCPIDGGHQWWFQQKTGWKKSNVNIITIYCYLNKC